MRNFNISMEIEKLSRVQTIGNTEWVEYIVGKSWEVITDKDEEIKQTGVERCEDQSQSELMAITANIVMGVDITKIDLPEIVVKIAK